MEDIAFFQTIYNSIIQHPVLSYWIVFISGILEGTIFVGLLIPTGLLIVAYGFVAYNGHIIGSNIMAVAILGAVLGDVINYAFGRYHIKKHQLKKTSKVENLFKEKKYMEHGRLFFERHGGKSVLLGRFIGMIRPFISFISGTAEMPFRKFMTFNIAGAILWVVSYFSLGYLFGSSATGLYKLLGKIGDITFFFTAFIAMFFLLKIILNRRLGPAVIKRSDELIEKIDKKDVL